jgi:hypothetical protein
MTWSPLKMQYVVGCLLEMKHALAPILGQQGTTRLPTHFLTLLIVVSILFVDVRMLGSCFFVTVFLFGLWPKGVLVNPLCRRNCRCCQRHLPLLF